LGGNARYTTADHVFAIGNVTSEVSSNSVGGLFGAANDSISESFATGKITAPGEGGGGFIGTYAGETSQLTNNYWNVDSSGQSQGLGTFWGGEDAGGVRGVSPQAEAAAQAAAQAAAEAAAQAAAEAAAQAVATTAGSELTGTLVSAFKPEGLIKNTFVAISPLADLLDGNIVFVPRRDFSLDVQSIEVGGEKYELEKKAN
jgi:hypothetical protein